MNDVKSITSWGFRASVHIKYGEDIHSLTKLLAKELLLPEITMDTDEDPPHEFFGMCEILRLEISVRKSTHHDYKFLFDVDTEDSLQEVFGGRIHDMSIWFARQVSSACDLETLVFSNLLDDGELHTGVGIQLLTKSRSGSE